VRLVQGCLNGSRRPGEHPALPVTPAELARDARETATAGAFSVHVHPRGADGSETLDPADCAAALNAIREACPGLPVGLSTGAWIEPDPGRRLDLIRRWQAPPDFVSVNMHEPGAAALVRDLGRLGIGVEAGIPTVAAAREFVDQDVAGLCLRVLVELPEPELGAALASAAGIDAVLDAAGVRVPRLYHGADLAAWAVIEAMLARGRDVRVGLEDVLVLADGRTAAGNADLVAAAVALGRGLRQ